MTQDAASPADSSRVMRDAARALTRMREAVRIQAEANTRAALALAELDVALQRSSRLHMPIPSGRRSAMADRTALLRDAEMLIADLDRQAGAVRAEMAIEKQLGADWTHRAEAWVTAGRDVATYQADLVRLEAILTVCREELHLASSALGGEP
jgi:hypothetical protein